MIPDSVKNSVDGKGVVDGINRKTDNKAACAFHAGADKDNSVEPSKKQDRPGVAAHRVSTARLIRQNHTASLMILLLGEHPPETSGTNKLPFGAKVSDNANPKAWLYLTYVPTGENGVGKLIPPKRSPGTH